MKSLSYFSIPGNIFFLYEISSTIYVLIIPRAAWLTFQWWQCLERIVWKAWSAHLIQSGSYMVTGLPGDHTVVKESNMGSFGEMFNSKNMVPFPLAIQEITWAGVLRLLWKHRDVGTSMVTLSVAIIIWTLTRYTLIYVLLVEHYDQSK